MTAPRDILDFWFNEAGPKRWFAVDAAFDADIRTRFETIWRAAKEGALDHWQRNGQDALALLILLDQFPRNMFRGAADAFSTDAKARSVAMEAVANGFDVEMPLGTRVFFYLPFMHGEDAADQERSVALIGERIGKESQNYAFALEHRDIIARFGRFPGRNRALSRVSTLEEKAYIESGGRF